jgi:aerobic C4-dicarboxylate transport protein
VNRVLAGELPFDEKTLLDSDEDDVIDVAPEVPEQGGEKELAKA